LTRRQVIAIAAAAGLLALVPRFASEYAVAFLLGTLLFVALGQGWNLISGYAGYLSFGQMSFFGIGAYTVAILTARQGWHWLPATLCGGLLSAILAVPLGWLMLRLRGPYFALGMLGLGQVLATTATAWPSLTGGGQGIYLPPGSHLAPLYYTALALVALALAGSLLLERSPFGLRLAAIREDEIAAEAMGVDTTRAKLAAFVLASILPGLCGGLHAWQLGYLDPAGAFPAGYEVQVVLLVLAGGAGTAWGPLIGGVLLSLLGELLWARFPELHLALFGLLILLILLFLPGGLWNAARRSGKNPRPLS
jgi:branched-chain amino acid transport system permease protein